MRVDLRATLICVQGGTFPWDGQAGSRCVRACVIIGPIGVLRDEGRSVNGSVDQASPEAGKPRHRHSWRRWLISLFVSVIVSSVLGWLFELALSAHKRAEFETLQARAYVAVAQFAPWRFAERYAKIVFIDDGSPSALKDATPVSTQFLMNQACRSLTSPSLGTPLVDPALCNGPLKPHGWAAFYLSVHVPSFLRPITAVFDLILHALVDQRFVGFLVALTQFAIGVLATRYFVLRRPGFKFSPVHLVGLPFCVIALGSLLALPLWLFAWIGLAVFKGLPGIGVGAQAGGTATLLVLFGGKTVEAAAHEGVMKQVGRFIGE
jgi:hypothetical protein